MLYHFSHMRTIYIHFFERKKDKKNFPKHLHKRNLRSTFAPAFEREWP